MKNIRILLLPMLVLGLTTAKTYPNAHDDAALVGVLTGLTSLAVDVCSFNFLYKADAMELLPLAVIYNWGVTGLAREAIVSEMEEKENLPAYSLRNKATLTSWLTYLVGLEAGAITLLLAQR